MKTKTRIIIFVAVLLVIIAAVVIAVINIHDRQIPPVEEENEGPSHTEVEIPIGKYYLGGDKNSDFYFNVMEGHKVEIVCPDLRGVIRDSLEWYYLTDEAEDLESAVDKNYIQFAGIKDYMAVHLNDLNETLILIEWSMSTTGLSGMGYSYPRENVITWTAVEDEFILVE